MRSPAVFRRRDDLVAIASIGILLCVVIHILCRRLVPIDFDVYRQGGADVLRRTGSLYAIDRPALPFTYPPFAALLFAPAALLPSRVAAIGMELLSCTAVAFTATRLVDLTGIAPLLRGRPVRRWPLLLGASALMCCLNPVWETLAKGQINLVLMAVCLLGLTADRRFLGGVLVGLCGGVKLTPLALGLIALKQRDRRFLLGIGCGLAGSIAAALLVLPAESRLYWGRLAWDPGRTGMVGFAANASLNGVIHRLLPWQGAATATWIAAVAVTVAAGYIAMPPSREGGKTVASVGVGATVMLLVSPVSWNHHWVWLPFIAIWAATVVTSPIARWLLELLVAPVAVLGPLVICRTSGIGENHPWNPLVWWAADILPLTAFAVLVVAAAVCLAPPGVRHDGGDADSGEMVPITRGTA